MTTATSAPPPSAPRPLGGGLLARLHEDPQLRHLISAGELPRFLAAMEGRSRLARGELRGFQASLHRAGISDPGGRPILVDDLVGPQMRGMARQLRREAGDLLRLTMRTGG
jgi:hypothetical protein